jgi:hypothetical protein
MRELEPAGYPAIDPALFPRAARVSSSRMAIVASLAAHALALYALTQQQLASLPAPQRAADYFVFELPRPTPAPKAPPGEPAEERMSGPPPEAEPAPERAVVEPAPPANERAAEPTGPPSERRASSDEPQPAAPDEAAPATPSRALIDFDEERRRATREVIAGRAAGNEYRTFSLDDVAPPRPEREPKRERSIFDGGGANFGGRSVGTVGQQRTKIGRKLAELCNALTGGFAGFGLFSACASPDTSPTGLFPEVRPAYLDLLPECADTRDTAPALALEAPFPTVKCRLVKREAPEQEP